MRTNYYPIYTQKHKLDYNHKNFIYKFMLKSGLIRKLSSGIYIWLPNGLRIIKKIKQILNLEMIKIGGIEINLPLLQPVDIWYKSKRFYTYGNELIKICDRHNKYFILSPTNEEIIVYLIENEKYLSKNDLPIILYQITKKFRDEKRPKFGLMRCKEFFMKDAYSFHNSKFSLNKTYELMIKSYKKCFNIFKLNYNIVKAYNGNIGGSLSHEFHVITNNGEDRIAISDNLNYIANLEIAKKKNIINKPILNPLYWNKNKNKFLKKIIINENNNLYLLNNKIKTIFLKIDNPNNTFCIAVLCKYNQKINILKISEHLNSNILNINIATKQYITESLKINCQDKFFGPIGLNIPILIDENIVYLTNFIVGANLDNRYFINVNWGRDLSLSNQQIGDFCNIVEGDLCPNNKSKLNIKNSMEIAHIFKLGNKYLYKYKSLYMGCYGIGINRLLIAIIEQNLCNNHQSIIYPIAISPFQIVIIPINMYNSEIVYSYANKFYIDLLNNNIEVLFDDRKTTPGIMLTDMELMGIPYVIILSESNLKNDCIEFTNRKSNFKIRLSKKNIMNYIYNHINII